MTDSHTIQQTRRRRFFCGALLVLLLLSSPLNAQDIHFSQIDINPILYDPAYSGFFDGIGRFGLTYRNQWSSVSKAFQTVAATAELSLLRRKRNGDGLNLGCILFSDRAGTLHYGTTAGNIILSYYKSLNSSNNSFLSGAIELGAGQAGFNTGDIVMEDPSDNMPSTAANFVTLGAGLAWFVQPNDDCFVKLGVSARNLNQPDISFLELDDARIERRFNAYARAEFRTWPNVALLPIAAASFQKQYREIIVGCDAKWYLSESSFRFLTLAAGMRYRWRDAATVEFSAEYNAFIFALSYDANISKLTPASKSIGAFELAIVYRLAKNNRVHRKALPCPIL